MSTSSLRGKAPCMIASGPDRSCQQQKSRSPVKTKESKLAKSGETGITVLTHILFQTSLQKESSQVVMQLMEQANTTSHTVSGQRSRWSIVGQAGENQ